MSAAEIIKQKILSEGPISFRDFMDLALYHPQYGYYTAPVNRIGTQGDYYTSPCLTPLVGEMIGKQIEQMWEATGRSEFAIVEYGGGKGLLCSHILNYIKENTELYARLRYHIIERGLPEHSNTPLASHPNVSWRRSLGDLQVDNGCILSNELLDNFPVHQVVMQEELKEVFVEFDGGFCEVLRPASQALRDYLEELKISLSPGFRTEINLQALDWLREISSALRRGFVLTIDYGFEAAALYDERRRCGTLMCYHRHQTNTDPYHQVGEQDITTHVNFSALQHWGSRLGLSLTRFTDQAEFLRSLGLTEHIRQQELSGKYRVEDLRKKIFLVHTLLMDMGRKFKVLIQQKGLPLASTRDIQGAQLLGTESLPAVA